MKKVVDTFSYREFIDKALNRERDESNPESSRTGSQGFTQTESFEETMKFATEGWDLGLEQYKIEDGVLTSGTTHLNPSLAGCMPHVQNYIMGFPQQMYDLYDEREYNLPTLDLIVSLGYAGGVDGSDALKFSKSLVGYINKMSSTHNIRLTGIFATKQRGTEYDVIVNLKDFDKAMVVNNIAFAFHPSFFRRLWFSIAESKPFLSSGYGQSRKNYKQSVEKTLDTSKSDKVIFTKDLGDVDEFTWSPEDIESVTF
tara:strand:- start:294 stop:1061 length:768 start_codon:yes stop_codon:yes gene_type:complete